ncbi:uncharacterized membrane protein (DUF485 family) [Pedobacter sp. CG_S7]|uniref:hypothetical protein n=1 Tax=Pedobacter sp. CG_S7 TaxID=3143930 RepID=UPI0033980554
MNQKQLLKFITDNQESDLKDFYDKSYAKLQELNKRIDKTTLSLIIIVLVYFLLAKSSVESFSIGPFNIKDIGVIGELLPVLFAYLLFDLIICSIHKTEVLITVKLLFLTLYKQKIELADFDKNNVFTRILLPFSFTTDLSRLVSGKTPVAMGCIGIALALPVLALYILPFYLEYHMLKDIFNNSYHEITGKVSFYLTIYINLMLLFYYAKVSLTNYQDLKSQQEDTE